MKIRLGLPKGSLQESTIELFKKAGFNIKISERSYFPSIDDEEIEVMLARAQEIPKYVEQGILDVGLSGKDWISETEANVDEIEDLVYSKGGLGKVKIVLAVSNDSKINNVKDLGGKRVATELVNLAKKYLQKNNIKADVEFSWGATEAKVPELADAIIEITETGSSLRANNLKIIDVLMESNTKLIANKKSMQDKFKREKIEKIALLLRGALEAEEKVGLKMNVKKTDMEKVINLLPALMKPTVSELSDKEWVAIETVIDEKIVRDIIPKLKKAGAQGIIEYPLNKVIE